VQQAHPHSRETFASAAAWLICAAATIATITGAYAWSALCQDGTFDRCPNGNPSFELVFQLVLAGAGLASTLVMRFLVRRRRYHFAGVALVIAVLLFASWGAVLGRRDSWLERSQAALARLVGGLRTLELSGAGQEACGLSQAVPLLENAPGRTRTSNPALKRRSLYR
jgi:hypothetical protein